MKKACSKCKKELPGIYYSPNIKTKDGLQSCCKPCCLLYFRTEKHKAYLKSYRQTEKRKAYMREWIKTKRKNDFCFYTNCKLQQNLGNSIKHKAHLNTLLSFTSEQFETHISNLFREDMSFENHGPVWHIDHIIPKKLLPYQSTTDENFIKLWELKNLQPIYATENLSNNYQDTSF